MSARRFHVLLVEDNEADVLLMESALAACPLRTELHVETDGPQALLYLRAGDARSSRAGPHLVLLDLNLPGMHGEDVLAEMKADPHLRATPVVVFTGSRSLDDVSAAYDRHANSYITKPSSFAGYEEVVRRIEEYWFATAQLPECAP